MPHHCQGERKQKHAAVQKRKKRIHSEFENEKWFILAQLAVTKKSGIHTRWCDACDH